MPNNVVVVICIVSWFVATTAYQEVNLYNNDIHFKTFISLLSNLRNSHVRLSTLLTVDLLDRQQNQVCPNFFLLEIFAKTFIQPA